MVHKLLRWQVGPMAGTHNAKLLFGRAIPVGNTRYGFCIGTRPSSGDPRQIRAYTRPPKLYLWPNATPYRALILLRIWIRVFLWFWEVGLTMTCIRVLFNVMVGRAWRGFFVWFLFFFVKCNNLRWCIGCLYRSFSIILKETRCQQGIGKIITEPS